VTAAAKYQSAYTLSLLAFQKGVRALGSAATSFCRVIPPLLNADPPPNLRTPFCVAPQQKGVRTLGQPCGPFCRVILRLFRRQTAPIPAYTLLRSPRRPSGAAPAT